MPDNSSRDRSAGTGSAKHVDKSTPPEFSSPADAASGTADNPEVNASRRSFLKGLASLGTGLAASTLLPASSDAQFGGGGGGGVPVAPGSPKSWQASVGLYGGNFCLSAGNTQLSLPVCGWGGLGRRHFLCPDLQQPEQPNQHRRTQVDAQLQHVSHRHISCCACRGGWNRNRVCGERNHVYAACRVL